MRKDAREKEPRYRAVFRRFHTGESVIDLAIALRCSTTAIENHIRRAMKEQRR